jgi:hypothetical protein
MTRALRERMVAMPHLEARPVDPRDTTWEVWDPSYRVYFWYHQVLGGWVCREYEVTGGDVSALFDWANENTKSGETFMMFAVVARGGEIGLVRLSGDDPTRSQSTSL